MLQFVHQTRLAASCEEVFAFHKRTDILNLLIPPWHKVRIVSRRGGLETGARVEIRLLFGPLYITWVAVHTDYQKNRLFVDEQVRGPFAHWRHRHVFQPDGGGCILRDEISYSLPLGLDPLFGWLVAKDLRRMFMYRHETTARELSPVVK
ncbi:MAG: SRPBCC family protein [Bryobacteraceae bacterium]